MRCRFRAEIRESNILQTESSQALVVVGGRLPPIDAPSARYEALHIGGGSTVLDDRDRAPPWPSVSSQTRPLPANQRADGIHARLCAAHQSGGHVWPKTETLSLLKSAAGLAKAEALQALSRVLFN